MERWSKTLNTRMARGGAMAWYSVDERLLTTRLAPKIAQPVTCQPSPRRAACTTITTRAATESAEAMPEVMLLAISSRRVYFAIGSKLTRINCELRAESAPAVR